MNRDRLRVWVHEARAQLQEVGRQSVGDHVIGEVLSGSPADSGGTWPCAPVRGLMEELRSKDLEQGFYIGVVNSRGVVAKDPPAGGAQERALADHYEGHAAAVAARFSRTARLLRRIAASYRQESRREDFEVEMGEDLGL